MSAGILIDSDVLVWLTRGHTGAAQRLQDINPWHISVVTYMELAQGCRDKAELRTPITVTAHSLYGSAPDHCMPDVTADFPVTERVINLRQQFHDPSDQRSIFIFGPFTPRPHPTTH